MVALVNLLRGITAFHLFDGTRFYINLIFSSLYYIKYFFLMFSYSTFTFGCLLMISRDQGLSFASIWGDSYNLSFGNYEATDTGVYFMQYIVYFAATVFNVILMLNLLISVLGDSYEKFKSDQAIVDIQEKARIAMEYQLMMFWTKRDSPLKYIKLCKSAFEDEEEQDWQGIIRFIDRKLDATSKEFSESNDGIGRSITEASASIEENVKSNITLLDRKMQSTIELKMNESNKNLEKKMTESLQNIEARLTENNELMEAKIKEISVSMSAQVQEINQKLEVLLRIISK